MNENYTRSHGGGSLVGIWLLHSLVFVCEFVCVGIIIIIIIISMCGMIGGLFSGFTLSRPHPLVHHLPPPPKTSGVGSAVAVVVDVDVVVCFCLLVAKYPYTSATPSFVPNTTIHPSAGSNICVTQ